MSRFLLVCCLVGLWWVGSAHAAQESICSTAAVIVCENFDDRSLGTATTTINTAILTKTPAWAVSDTSMSVVNTQAFDGTKSLQWTYGAGSAGAGFFDLGIPSRRDYYIRFYMKNESTWVWSTDGNKMVFIGNPVSGHGDNLIFDQAVFGGSTPAWRPQYATNQSYPFQLPNVSGGAAFPLNQWVCVEFHPTMNSSPGSVDGQFEGWIDGVLKYQNTAVNMSATETVWNHFKFSGYWNAGTGSHPLMHRWIDSIVVSTARIGCAGASSDITPPTIPTNLAAVAQAPNSLHVSWTASTDAGSGVSGYRIETCMPAPCSNFTQIVQTGTQTFYDITGLPVSTAINIRIRAQDVAGNISGYTATVTGTTNAAVALAHINSITTDTTGADLTMLGATYAVRYYTDTIPTTVINGLGGVTSYRHNLAWDALSTFVCYAAQDVNGIWENDADATSYKCNSVHPADTTAPTVPANLRLATLGAQNMTLTYDASVDASLAIIYLMEHCVGAGCSDFAPVGSSNTLLFTDMGLLTATSHSWRVRAQDPTLNTSGYSNVFTQSTDTVKFHPTLNLVRR